MLIQFFNIYQWTLKSYLNSVIVNPTSAKFCFAPGITFEEDGFEQNTLLYTTSNFHEENCSFV